MDITVSIHPYSAGGPLRLTWQSGHEIAVSIEDGEVVIRANREGLQTLAAHCLTLAQAEVPAGHHFHLDPGSGLAADAAPLILERV
jgi:hypothetical protein